MATSLPLVFNAPRRGMPATHFADLDNDGRKAAVQELGLPAFRADQIARHYFSRLEADPLTMTDLPADKRQTVKDALFPTLLTPVRHVTADNGQTRKTLWRCGDGTMLESVLMNTRTWRDLVYFLASWVRYGMPILRYRPRRAAAQSLYR